MTIKPILGKNPKIELLPLNCPRTKCHLLKCPENPLIAKPKDRHLENAAGPATVLYGVALFLLAAGAIIGITNRQAKTAKKPTKPDAGLVEKTTQICKQKAEGFVKDFPEVIDGYKRSLESCLANPQKEILEATKTLR